MGGDAMTTETQCSICQLPDVCHASVLGCIQALWQRIRELEAERDEAEVIGFAKGKNSGQP
jgi:hypothetical protein